MPLLAGLTALLLLIFGINLIDQRIDPAAVSALDFSAQAPIADAENAYYALYGFRAAASADPHAAGIAFVTSANSRKERAVPEAVRAPEELKFIGSTEELCKQRRENCLRQYRAKQGDIRKLARRNSVLLDRYRALYRYPAFQETLDKRFLDTSFPPFPGDEHRVELALIGLAALDGETESALRALAADTLFWRRVLERTNTLITKMIATSFLDQNFALLSEIVQRYQHQPGVLSSAKIMVAPLTAAERSCAEAFRAEYAWQAGLFVAASEGHFDDTGLFDENPSVMGRALTRLMLQPNATINLLLSHYQTTVRIAEASAEELVEMSDMLAREEEQVTDIIRWDMVYNPVGKVLAAISAPSTYAYARYAGRVHNLDGRMRLVALQLALYEGRVPDGRIANTIAARPAAYHDPYRNAAMTWDPKRRAILFWGIGRKGPGLKLDQEIAVRL
jgi:hypothetical protein